MLENPEKDRQTYVGRPCFIQTREQKNIVFTKTVYIPSIIVGYNESLQNFVVQPYNLSGHKDGKPDAESPEDIWLLPATGRVVCTAPTEDSYTIDEYFIESLTVHLSPYDDGSRSKPKKQVQKNKNRSRPKARAKTSSKKKNNLSEDEAEAEAAAPAPRKRKSCNTAGKKTKKKKKNTRRSTKKKKRQPLDRVTTTDSTEIDDSEEQKYTLKNVLLSFENPRDELFTLSLKAELARHPELLVLKPENGDDNPPEPLFGRRRKGYFKCKSLCRVWVLSVIKWLRTRGEYFVQWDNPVQATRYDGLAVCAHAFTIKYCSIHKPGTYMGTYMGLDDHMCAMVDSDHIWVRIWVSTIIYGCSSSYVGDDRYVHRL